MSTFAATESKSWLDNAMKDYYRFFMKKFTVKSVNNSWYSITTPFLNMFNDCIEIYCCQQDNGRICLSDDGETLRNLDLAGVSLLHNPSTTRKNIFKQILLNYGVRVQKERGVLFLETDFKHFPQAKMNFINAIMEISDLHVLSRPTVQFAFKDDVKGYLDKHNIIYTPRFITRGSSGLDFTFDFQIAGKEKEILISAFNTLDKGKLTSFLFDWGDIKPIREEITGKKIAGVAVINDVGKKVDNRFLEALDNKGADYILYSQKDRPVNINKLKMVVA